jgi:subtilisin family serine protease
MPPVVDAPVQPAAIEPAKAPPLAEPDLPSEYADNGLILSLAPGTNPQDFLQANHLEAYQAFTLAGHPIVAVKAPTSDRGRLAKLPGVTRASLDMKAYPHADAPPADPLYPQQWAHQPQFANTQTAWTKLAGVNQRKVIIADVDSGMEVEHEEFEGRYVGRQNPTAYAKANGINPLIVADQFGHGTFTAGIAAAARDNTFGIAGVAYDALIMPIKVDHPEPRSPSDPRPQWGKFSLSDIIAGLAYICDNNDVNGAKVRVVNMSLGQNTLGVEPLYVEAVSYARRKGILVVASTGNNGGDRIPPPANTPGVVAVGATSHYLNYEFLSPDSNYGPRLDLVAPGGGILSTVPFTDLSELGARTDGIDLRGYAFGSGTSEAAPFVSGVAALVFAKYDPDNASCASPDSAAKMVDRVRAHLFRSVDDKGAPGWDPAFGWGRINVDKAMSASAPLPDGPAPVF